jgi:hypothetical protein
MPGGSYEFLLQAGVRDLDARVMMHYYATGITPAMEIWFGPTASRARVASGCFAPTVRGLRRAIIPRGAQPSGRLASHGGPG